MENVVKRLARTPVGAKAKVQPYQPLKVSKAQPKAQLQHVDSQTTSPIAYRAERSRQDALPRWFQAMQHAPGVTPPAPVYPKPLPRTVQYTDAMTGAVLPVPTVGRSLHAPKSGLLKKLTSPRVLTAGQKGRAAMNTPPPRRQIGWAHWKAHVKPQWMPRELVFPEDALREQFYRDHPMEKARPKQLDADAALHWTTEENGHVRVYNGEGVARYAVHLMQDGVTREDAYQRACALFYETMSFIQTEQRVALESLLHFGATYPQTEASLTMAERMQQSFAEEQAALKERWLKSEDTLQ